MKTILVILGLFLLVSCDSQSIKMGGSSMEPVFKKGDSVVINYKAYAKEAPKRWDVVAYQGKPDELWIHRVVGLPGETLIINTDGIYINGNKLPTPNFLSHISYIPEEMLRNKDAKPPYREYNIPNNSYFLLGDNSPKSYDSRLAGPISLEQIKGKAQQ